jgi:hypothetical protein
MGYHYTGEDYWPSFERVTPGWAEYGDHEHVRTWFRKFSSQFGGALPQGAWANHFGIICWRITHAILPTDLQVQLAELLHESAPGLSPALLAEPIALGQWLASVARPQRSLRMQGLLQNAQLLGQIAGALLNKDLESADLIELTALRRIVDDLSRTHAGREWLRSARRSADRAVYRGFSTSGFRAGDTTPDALPRAAAIMGVEPSLVLLPETRNRWQMCIEIPDLSPIAGLSPTLRTVLSTERCKVNGSTRSPLARGQCCCTAVNA